MTNLWKKISSSSVESISKVDEVKRTGKNVVRRHKTPPSTPSTESSNVELNDDDGCLPLKTKLAYAVEEMRIRALYVSIILAVRSIADGLTDPLMGMVVTKVTTRFGRMRPWILFGSIPTAFCYIGMWWIPFKGSTEIQRFFWLLIFHVLFVTTSSTLRIPHTALNVLLTHNQRERELANLYRTFMELIAFLVSSILQGLMIARYSNDNEKHRECINNEYVFIGELNDVGEQANKGYIYAAVIVERESVVKQSKTKLSFEEVKDYNDNNQFINKCIENEELDNKEEMETDFNRKQKIQENNELISKMDNGDGGKRPSFREDFKMAMKLKSYVLLTTHGLLFTLAVLAVQSHLALYVEHVLHYKQALTYIIFALLFMSVFSLPLWHYLSTKYGKKTTLAIGVSSAFPSLYILIYLQNPPWIMFIVAVTSGASVGAIFLIPWSMLPDVVDEYTIKYGQRKEAIFYSLFVVVFKLFQAILLGLSQIMLGAAGYNADQCVQPPSVALMLRVLVVPIPFLLMAIGLVVLWLYPINEDTRAYMKKQLDQMRLEAEMLLIDDDDLSSLESLTLAGGDVNMENNEKQHQQMNEIPKLPSSSLPINNEENFHHRLSTAQQSVVMVTKEDATILQSTTISDTVFMGNGDYHQIVSCEQLHLSTVTSPIQTKTLISSPIISSINATIITPTTTTNTLIDKTNKQNYYQNPSYDQQQQQQHSENRRNHHHHHHHHHHRHNYFPYNKKNYNAPLASVRDTLDVISHAVGMASSAPTVGATHDYQSARPIYREHHLEEIKEKEEIDQSQQYGTVVTSDNQTILINTIPSSDITPTTTTITTTSSVVTAISDTQLTLPKTTMPSVYSSTTTIDNVGCLPQPPGAAKRFQRLISDPSALFDPFLLNADVHQHPQLPYKIKRRRSFSREYPRDCDVILNSKEPTTTVSVIGIDEKTQNGTRRHRLASIPIGLDCGKGVSDLSTTNRYRRFESISEEDDQQSTKSQSKDESIDKRKIN
ncbi:hypothetical protein SNEBB_004880 [Seison nebaliae]|nr:hypothetical protein SNEBB_004880 [Seison nebaliae]